MSNFAKPGHRSRHNLAYWQGLDYVGVGPGAHGRITRDGTRQSTIAHLTPGAYVKAVTQTGSGLDSLETLTGAEWATEYLLMGLRIEGGISLTRYAELAGTELNSAETEHLIQDGFLSHEGDRLKATAHGRLVLNAVTERLLLA